MHRSTHAGSRRRARRALLAAAVPAVLAVVGPAAAQAADVTAVGTEIVVEDTTSFHADSNRLTAESLPGGELRLVDQVGLVAKAAGCFQLSPTEVRCLRPASSPISKLTFRGRGGGDRLTMLGSLPVRYEGGGGDDAYIGATLPGVPTQVDFSGGGQLGDLTDYSRAEASIDVRKNERPNDGRFSVDDKDNIRNDVQIVRGTRFRDTLHGARTVVGVSETFEPQGGDDFVLGGLGVTDVNMGAAADGADKILGEPGTVVSYEKRTNPIRAAVDLGGADDGEAGEGDELLRVGMVTGGSAGDTLLVPENRTDGVGIAFRGGPGADIIEGTNAGDNLDGGPGRDRLEALGGADQLSIADGELDTLFCGAGFDTASTDAAEATVRDCEKRTAVGTLDLSPKRLQVESGKIVRLRLSWRHPEGWKQLRKIELRLTREGAPVGEITIHTRAGRIADGGATEVLPKRTRLTREGKTVTARLAVRVAEKLAGQELAAEVEATDVRGKRQLERNAGTVRISQ